jgi:hypothetical protein
MAFLGNFFSIWPVIRSQPGAFLGLICCLIILSTSLGVTGGIIPVSSLLISSSSSSMSSPVFGVEVFKHKKTPWL